MKPISIVPAQLTDCSDLFAWRNDPITQRNSKNAAPVVWDTHVAWFTAALKSPNRMIYIGYKGTLKIGSIRFDRLEDALDSYLISIMVAPAQRGQGFGGSLLREGIATLPNATLRAEVASQNIASRRIFESCGFKSANDHGHSLLQYRLEPSRD